MSCHCSARLRSGAFLLLACCVFPAGCLPHRPPLPGIASAHPLATQAGMEILAGGGNAFDAAVAVSAALAVVEPYSSGIGGGGFWLLHRARDGFEVMVDGRERRRLPHTVICTWIKTVMSSQACLSTVRWRPVFRVSRRHWCISAPLRTSATAAQSCAGHSPGTRRIRG